MDNENQMGNNENYLRLARQLVSQLEAGEDEAGYSTLEELTQLRETEMFQQIGKLTRDLHEALNSFQVDTRISTLAEHEIPDARERLRYVVSMTDQAANRTLNAVEQSLPLCDDLQAKVDEIGEGWNKFLRKELSVEEFRALSRDIKNHLKETSGQVATLKGNLNEVLMAQDYQDLTGQIIHRVINLVEEVEGNLVELIRISGGRAAEGDKTPKSATTPAAAAEVDSSIEPQGPQVPGVDHADAVSGQDEVDELLSSLGF
ncbi:MAG: protein phosphatase CheZ [Pseudomonadota bacterium]